MSSMNQPAARPLAVSPDYDPWDPIISLREYGRHRLTSVEMTVTTLCNMRCEHCAVGDSLTLREEEKIPLSLMLHRLDEIEALRTISITGGEPSYSRETVEKWILPLLRYAKERGLQTQLNSNLTLDLDRYALIAPYLDVMHISYNYPEPEDFHRIGFANSSHPVSPASAMKLYDRMLSNARELSAGGLFISAETMINTRTADHLPALHQRIVEMGCRRHEIHPMYPSSFAANLPVLDLPGIRTAIHRLLDTRHPDIWMLFGTLPFYACSDDAEDLALLRRLRTAPGVTVRNDPDGRNRLNVNLFGGGVYVTDFAEVSALGNVFADSLEAVFERWLAHPLNRAVDCRCLAANCCGPNLLVRDAYYPEVDFQARTARI